MTPPKISFSVITVVCNDLHGLKRTYDSISLQVNQNFEWIVVDAGSNDGTVDFLKGLSFYSLKWVSEKDDGIYDAMNKGVSISSGDFVVFMNAGDIFADQYSLEYVSNCLEYEWRKSATFPSILFGGAMLRFPNAGDALIYRPPRLAGTLWHGLPANHQSTYYLRDLIIKYPYDLRYKLCGDYYLAAKLIKCGARDVYLNKSLCVFEVGGLSYTRKGRLFLEPFLIQRDVLGLPVHYLFASALKRLISTLGFMLLSQPLFNSFLRAYRRIRF